MSKKTVRIFLIVVSLFSLIFGVFYLYENTSIFCMTRIVAPTRIENVSKKSMESQNKTRLDKAIEQGLVNVEETIIIRNKIFYMSMDKLTKSIARTINNNAEIMYYKGVNYSKGSLDITYSKDQEEIKKHQNELRDIREYILKKIIVEDMNDFDKIKSIHDYVINNTEFDDLIFIQGEVPHESYTAYGVLVLGVGVCEGYAKAVKYLLDEVEIDSIVVLGKLEGENHAWNLINIGGDYYHLDTTCNDPLHSHRSENMQYNYFNISDDEISASHAWDKKSYPLAVGSFYNFFNYKDLVLKEEQEVEEIIKTALFNSKSGLIFKYEKYEDEDFNLDKVIKEIAYNNCKTIKLNTYSYILDENQGIYQIDFNYR